MVDFLDLVSCKFSLYNAPIFPSSSSALYSLPGVENSPKLLLFPSAGLEPGPLNVKPLNVKREQLNGTNHSNFCTQVYCMICFQITEAVGKCSLKGSGGVEDEESEIAQNPTGLPPTR